MAKVLYLIDVFGYLFRAFYALPPMLDPNGNNINAVYGFSKMMLNILESKDDMTHIVLALDTPSKEGFRKQIYSAYKENRQEAPPELSSQIPILQEAIEAFGLKTLQKQGFEADDIIATLANQSTNIINKENRNENDLKVIIVSSDKDLTQLVKDQVVILDPIKNIILDSQGVREKMGVYPEQVIDLQALCGDSSDNIPGVRGIGPKTAIKLLEQESTLENIIAAAHDQHSDKAMRKVAEMEEMALISKELVTLDTNVDLKWDWDEIRKPDNIKESQKLADFFQDRGFMSLIKFLKKESKKYKIIELNSLEEFLEKTTGKIAILKKPNEDKLIAYARSEDSHHGNNLEQVSYLLKEAPCEVLSCSRQKVTHDLKQLYKIAQKQNIKVEDTIDDVMLMSYALEAGVRRDFSLKAILSKDIEGNASQAESQEQEYVKEISELIELEATLKKDMIKAKTSSVYQTLDKPLSRILSCMESYGIGLDQDKLSKVDLFLKKEIYAISKKIFEISEEEFNLSSPQQLSQVLMNKFKVKLKKTKSGNYVTDRKVLEELSVTESKDSHSSAIENFAKYMLEWRKLNKLYTTYTQSLAKQINPTTGKVHTNFHINTTATGRLSSSDPNLQNIPVNLHDEKSIRSCFIPESGKIFISADYSQIELRVLAHIANVKLLKKAFQLNQDIHKATASEILGLPIEKVTKKERDVAKMVNFGIIYGISPYGLSSRLSCPLADAKHYIESYFDKYPEIKLYMEECKDQVIKKGYVTTLYGRRCHVPNIHIPAQKAFGERAAINAPIQGTAADIMKLAMIRVFKLLDASQDTNAKMLLQVHDEILLEVDQSEAEQIGALVEKEMIKASHAKLEVPMQVHIKLFQRWA